MTEVFASSLSASVQAAAEPDAAQAALWEVALWQEPLVWATGSGLKPTWGGGEKEGGMKQEDL